MPRETADRIAEASVLHALGADALAQKLDGPGRSRHVFRALAAGSDPFAPGVLPDGLRARLSAVTEPGRVTVRQTRVAHDETAKILLGLADGAAVESVLIPENSRDSAPSRATLCVSSQVGCARGCQFCSTATMGLKRNLSVAEIVQQVHLGLGLARTRGWTLRNLVFMGMGEPLDNAPHVRAALDILTDHRGYGFAPKHVTVSTVGPRVAAVRGLRGWPARLAWSLHAATEAVRDRVVPRPHPSIDEIAGAFAEVCAADRRPLFVEMTLIDGLNDSSADMLAAAELFRDFPTEVRFNLIAMNPGRAGNALTGRLRPSRRVEQCKDALQSAGYFCSIRRPRGQDADAACGQLAIENLIQLTRHARSAVRSTAKTER